jgi:hypothetical protein
MSTCRSEYRVVGGRCSAWIGIHSRGKLVCKVVRLPVSVLPENIGLGFGSIYLSI